MKINFSIFISFLNHIVRNYKTTKKLIIAEIFLFLSMEFVTDFNQPFISAVCQKLKFLINCILITIYFTLL